MTEVPGVTFHRCETCGAVQWPQWPMTHRRNCPATTTTERTDR